MKYRLPFIALMILFNSALLNAQVSITAEETTACAGESIYLLATGGDVYSWSISGGNLDSLTGDSVNFTAPSSGVYTVTVYGTDTASATTDSFSVSIDVVQPSVATSAVPMLICEGDTAGLIVATGTANAISWAPSSTLGGTGDTVQAFPIDTTTYFVTVTDTMGCTTIDSVTLNVLPAPDVTIFSTAGPMNDYICKGDSAVLTAQSASAVSYVWSPATGLDNDTGSIVVASPTSNTTYTVSVTDTEGCTNTATKIVRVTEIAFMFINAASDTICEGDTIMLQGGNAPVLQWRPANVLNPTSGSLVMAFPTTTTEFTLVGINQACRDSVTRTINVRAMPAMSYTQSSNGNALFQDESDLITVDCPSCVSYRWILPNGEFFSTSSVRNVSPHEPGTYQVTVEGTDAKGCRNLVNVTVVKKAGFIGVPFGVGAMQEESQFTVLYSETAQSIRVSSTKPAQAEVEVYTLTGASIYKGRFNGTTHSIATEGIASGIFFVGVTTDTGEQKVYKTIVP